MTGTYRLGRVELDRIPVLWAALVANVLFLFLALYYLLDDATLFGPTPVVVPLIWLTVGAWALASVDPPAAARRHRSIAAAIAGAYWLVLGFLGGVLSLPAHDAPTSIRVTLLDSPPGWNPAVYLSTDIVQVTLIPWRVVGYVALAALVYETALVAAVAVAERARTDASEFGTAALGGFVGLFSCVSCTWPIVVQVVGGLLGGTGSILAPLTGISLLASTAVFVATVATLRWRPGLG